MSVILYWIHYIHFLFSLVLSKQRLDALIFIVVGETRIENDILVVILNNLILVLVY